MNEISQNEKKQNKTKKMVASQKERSNYLNFRL